MWLERLYWRNWRSSQRHTYNYVQILSLCGVVMIMNDPMLVWWSNHCMCGNDPMVVWVVCSNNCVEMTQWFYGDLICSQNTTKILFGGWGINEIARGMTLILILVLILIFIFQFHLFNCIVYFAECGRADGLWFLLLGHNTRSVQSSTGRGLSSHPQVQANPVIVRYS